MWTHDFEVNGYQFRLISEWLGGVTIGVNLDYEPTPEFLAAFTQALSIKDEMSLALELDYQAQGNNMNFAKQFHADTDEEWIDFLKSVKDNQYLSHGLHEMVTDELNNVLNKQAKRDSAKIVRKEFQREYDRLFMLVGRRDGFEYVVCGVTKDLSIDHKTAVINGGTNDPENLQLMCRSHNSSKGAK